MSDIRLEIQDKRQKKSTSPPLEGLGGDLLTEMRLNSRQKTLQLVEAGTGTGAGTAAYGLARMYLIARETNCVLSGQSVSISLMVLVCVSELAKLGV